MPTLERTRFAIEEIKAFCLESNASPLIQSYFASYLTVLYYSESEQVVRKILESRLARIADQKVSSFIYHGSRNIFDRIKKNDLVHVLKMFGCADPDLISAKMSESDVQSYAAIILDRHNTSHGAGANVTITQVEDAVPCAERLFNAFEEMIA